MTLKLYGRGKKRKEEALNTNTDRSSVRWFRVKNDRGTTAAQFNILQHVCKRVRRTGMVCDKVYVNLQNQKKKNLQKPIKLVIYSRALHLFREPQLFSRNVSEELIAAITSSPQPRSQLDITISQ